MTDTITQDGIIVDTAGADELIVALWDSGEITASNIRRLCTYMRDDEMESQPPSAVYVRYGDELAPAIVHVAWRAADDHVVVTVSRHRDDGRPDPRAIIARGAYPVPRSECVPCLAETAPHTCRP